MDRIRLGAADRLTAAGERVTRQRLLVANALAASGRRLTAEQLFRSLRRREPAIGRATVFRTLETLVEAGVARRLELDGHVYAYVACLPAHHHHIACTRCGRVEEIDDALLDFYGRCATCRAEAAAATANAG